jgi:hypothetical protein
MLYVLVLTYHDRTVNKRSRHVERTETRGRGTESIDAREEEIAEISRQPKKARNVRKYKVV